MITKYYVDADGNYLGGFQGDTGKVPVDAVEIPSPPAYGKDRWVNGAWVPAPSPVPPVVKLAQARKALMRSGLLAQVDAAARQPGNEEILQDWEYGDVIRRDSATVAALAAQLGITNAQLDDLFKLAATL